MCRDIRPDCTSALLVAVGGLLLALPTSASAFKVRGGKAVIDLGASLPTEPCQEGRHGKADRRCEQDRQPAWVQDSAGRRQTQAPACELPPPRRPPLGPGRSGGRHALLGAQGHRTWARGAHNGSSGVDHCESGVDHCGKCDAAREALFKLSKVRVHDQGRRTTAIVRLAGAAARRLNQALQLQGNDQFGLRGERVGSSCTGRWRETTV